MGRMEKTVATVLVSAALLVPVAACSSKSKTSTAASTTTTAGSSDSSKSFEITTSDGQVSLSLDGNLPPGWPSGFPLQGGAIPAGSGSLANSSQGKLVAVFNTSDSPQDTFNFYKGSSDLTVESSSSFGVGPAYVGTVAFSGTYPGRVTILARSGTTTIVVVLDATTGGAGGSTDTTGTAGY